MASYLGCYRDSNVRLLDRVTVDSKTMTVYDCHDSCRDYSEQSYFPLFGLEFGSQCYCGSNFAQEKPERVEDDMCGTTCSGNFTQICGGVWYISVYNITSAPSGKSPVPTQPIMSAKTTATSSVRTSSTSILAPISSTPSSSATPSPSLPTQNASNGLNSGSSFSASVAASPSPLVPRTTVIAIGVVAALFAVALFGVIAYLLLFRHKWKKYLARQQEKEIASTMNTNNGNRGKGSSPVEMPVGPAEMPAVKSSPGSPRVTLPPIPPHSPSVNRASIKTASYPFVSEHYHNKETNC